MTCLRPQAQAGHAYAQAAKPDKALSQLRYYVMNAVPLAARDADEAADPHHVQDHEDGPEHEEDQDRGEVLVEAVRRHFGVTSARKGTILRRSPAREKDEEQRGRGTGSESSATADPG